MTEHARLVVLFDQLTRSPLQYFPPQGAKVSAPERQGVYIIYSPKKVVLHVGNTPRARGGIRQRLKNHMRGQSSFTRNYLKGDGARLRSGYGFRCLVVAKPRMRMLLEAYAIGHLCPKHIGLGQLKE
jgi:hypothetical protein